MRFIAWFSELTIDDIPIAGGKGASLGEMFRADLPVPNGFAVTAQTYEYVIEKTGIADQIYDLLDDLDVEDTQKLQEAARKVQDLILKVEMPSDVKSKILEAYDMMDGNFEDLKHISREALEIFRSGKELPYVAVRSSATAEDLPEASFAGQQETFLNIKGNANLLKSVQKCWASLYTARAIYYRIKNNFPHDKVLISVLVQKQVMAQKSGVMFSVNPLNNNEDEVMIEAGYGLGEAVVSGSISPDQYIAEKSPFKIKTKTINKQDWMFALDVSLGATVRRSIPEANRNLQKISDFEIKQLVELAKKIEDHYLKPQDIEFAIEGMKVFIVQSRPITTLKNVDKTHVDNEIFSSEPLLKGTPASPGVVSGKVRIVRTPEDIRFVQQGEVLVAQMTSPDYVPAMRRASAIVTDAGGSTCFEGNTKVLTNKGFMRFEDLFYMVQDGDKLEILSYDYKHKKATWKKIRSSGRSKKEVIRAKVSQTGRSELNYIDVTSDHKFYTYTQRSLVKKKLSEMLSANEGACVLEKIPMGNSHCPSLAYLAGALFTDGYFHFDTRRGRVVFTQKRTPQKEKFISAVKEAFSNTFECDFTQERIKTSSNYINGRHVSGTATDFICSRRAPAVVMSELYLNIVEWAQSLDRESTLQFLGGVLDGDGSFYNNRIQLYIGKEPLVQAVVISCLKIGIVPQLTRNRTICNVQIVEKVDEILEYSNKITQKASPKLLGTKLFAVNQILGDVIDEVNYKGRIKPYVEKNLYLDAEKIKRFVLPLTSGKLKNELLEILDSDIRMQRIIESDVLGENYVYNVEVDSNDDMEKNYIVFTRLYTPLLVSNSHAAIVSRELGIPCVVGTLSATKVLANGREITVDGYSGKVYDGVAKVSVPETKVSQNVSSNQTPNTITEVKMLMDIPDLAERHKDLPIDGIGLMRLEVVIANAGVHPAKYVRENREHEYTSLLVTELTKVASVFKNKPIWVRTSDFRTDEYRNLDGGNLEPVEANPMLGWHGVRRGLDERNILRSEFLAIRKLHELGYTNVGIMIPFIISVDELKAAKELLLEVGMNPLHDVEFGVMIETPASVQIIDDLCKEGISFASIGSNDLTQLTLGVDRNNEHIAKLFSELNPAVLRSIKHVIETCKRFNVKSSICGQAGSNPQMAEFLVKVGIDSISVSPDAVGLIRETISQVEKKLLLSMARRELGL